MLQSWMSRILLAGFVVVAVWLLVISYWRISMHMPSTTDVVMYLVLTPVIFLLSVVMLKKLGAGLIAISGSANAGIAPSANVNTASEAESENTGRGWTLSVVAGSAITRLGYTADELMNALADKQPNFELDAQLVDQHGYPLLAARVDDLHEAETYEQFEQWLLAKGLPSAPWEQADKRALALVQVVYMELVQTLLSFPQLSELLSDSEINDPNRALPTINVITIFPKRWLDQQRQDVAVWLATLITQLGWPADKFQIHPYSYLSNSDPLTLIDQVNVEVNQQSLSGLYVFMATQSFMGEQAYAELQSERNAQGANGKVSFIPGEAAAGVVVADTLWAQKLGVEPLVRMHRIAQRKRDKSADAAGKIKPDVLMHSITDALVNAQIIAEQIGAVSADTDARASRIGELYEALSEVMPEMDLHARCFKMEAGCGVVGKVAGLLTLLAARQLVVADKQPVLCVSNNDEYERIAWVVDTGQITPDSAGSAKH